MRYLSVCSGIEAATVAWHPIGWESAAYSEIEAFPSAVLRHHYPDVPNLGDMELHRDWRLSDVDLLVGGTPCQSFSVAGLRKGMDDPRGNLALIYLAIAERLRPRWVVWENVPGVLSSNERRDFAALLGGFRQLGYLGGWRVLDAQYFGVPQRRRRVFFVGHLGDWRPAAAVLFERESLRRNPAPSREAREATAKQLSARTKGGGGLGSDHDIDGGLQVTHMVHVAAPLTAGGTQGSNAPGRRKEDDENLVACFDETQCTSPEYRWKSEPHTSSTLAKCARPPSIAFKQGAGAKAGGIGASEHVAPTLSAAQSGTKQAPGLLDRSNVRRLTPRECERLQGFPDDYTLIPYRGKPASDTARYRALGNSMAVPVMRWIGERIKSYETEKGTGR